ncbi:PREDICTED: uncharacterized protein LOC105568599 [Vollenhovia emeryi]|uniref:uncharacterized protein LOC105568599 n=1 Tax=Vollenhovia emeryi TaxID=411798 RepID=UPI0005F55019|nr:PREDICTED: uncharacterized protein LOC105568599 [Vollenhovia emeryi]
MFAIVFAFALTVVGYVSAEVPSFIHVCGRRDPNLDQCILDNVENLKDKICEGIPELDIPSNNPVILDDIVISDSSNSKINLRDVKAMGLCDFEVKYFKLDLDNLHFDAEIFFKRIQLNGTYDFDIRLLIPIVQKGPVYITSDNINAKANLDMNVVTKDSKRYVYMSKIKLNLDIKGYDVDYGINSEELNRLNQIISNFIGNNQEEVIKTLKPAIEEAVVKRILTLSNDIVKHFTFEELFPDKP